MLVATDIAARGVHVDEVELVVHVDPPAEHKAYLHRSGRTARAGSAGDVVTVVLPEQRRDTQVLMRKAGIKVAPQQVTATSDAVQALVGEIAPYQAPAPAQCSLAVASPASTERRRATASSEQQSVTEKQSGPEPNRRSRTAATHLNTAAPHRRGGWNIVVARAARKARKGSSAGLKPAPAATLGPGLHQRQ